MSCNCDLTPRQGITITLETEMAIIGPCGIINRDLDYSLDRCIPAILPLWDSANYAVAAQDQGDRFLFVGGFPAADAS